MAGPCVDTSHNGFVVAVDEHAVTGPPVAPRVACGDDGVQFFVRDVLLLLFCTPRALYPSLLKAIISTPSSGAISVCEQFEIMIRDWFLKQEKGLSVPLVQEMQPSSQVLLALACQVDSDEWRPLFKFVVKIPEPPCECTTGHHHLCSE